MNTKTFKRLTPLAIQLGDVLGGKNANDVEIALGMLIGLQYETPDELDEALENVKLAAAQYRVFTMNENGSKQ